MKYLQSQLWLNAELNVFVLESRQMKSISKLYSLGCTHNKLQEYDGKFKCNNYTISATSFSFNFNPGGWQKLNRILLPFTDLHLLRI